MTTSSILILLAVIYALVGIAMIVRPNFYEKVLDELLNHRAFMFILGIVSIVIGYVLGIDRGTFGSVAGGFITIIGILALIKGVIFLMLPTLMPKVERSIIGKVSMRQVGMLLLVFAAVCVFFALL